MSDLESDDLVQLSGTTVAPVAELPRDSLDDRHEHAPLDSPISSSDEQALESHEVIELQTFSERKVWIDEKIKFLEQLPPVEVFAGLDAVRTSAEHVPGVPTPDELKQWIAEHDVIEKETEIFDRGELTKLRQLTKAAAQRNLSPADTDLIELTLTTILELDKLLHLLRDRSENLELLATRLSWEQSRIAAWVDRRSILEDLQTFLDTRVRWTPSIYESVSLRGDETPDLKRRSSIASLASASSDTSSSSSSLGFSRGARFKLAESLSHDAAQFAGRVTGLRHGKITVAGKILDKLIDQSRKPVPDELLDEQDKLEEQGIAEMENLGKFVLNMVVQWRKADEVYVETMMDKTTAQNLFEEIETAKLHHPTARQSASFVSRADALIRRLTLRGNPASFTSTFSSPEHPLFSDQRITNQMLTQSLSSEFETASTVARKAEDAAKAYRTTFEAVKRVEDLTSTAKELSDNVSGIIAQLQRGILAEGDGSPPDLTSVACLELNRHSTFLAHFPSILQQFSHAADKSKQVLRHSVPAMLGLDIPGVDGDFINTARSHFKELELMLKQAQAASEDMSARCDRLKEARRLDAIMKETMNSLEDIEHRISASIETQRWRRVLPSEVRSADPQPFSPPPTETSHAEFIQELLGIDYRIDREVDGPFRLLVETLEDPLKLSLSQRSLELKGILDKSRKQGILLDSVQRQTAIMKAVYEEFCSIQRDVEALKKRFEAHTRDVLNDQLVNGGISQADTDLKTNLNAIQAEITHFVNRLSDRIPFVSRLPIDVSPSENNQPASLDSKFDLHALDTAVRADSNSFAMALSNHTEELNQHLAQFHLTTIAKDIDTILIPTAAYIDQLIEDLVVTRTSLSEIVSSSDDITLLLNALSQDVEQALKHGNLHVERSFSQIRELIRKAEAISDSGCKLFDDASALYKTWEEDALVLLDEIKRKYASEIERMRCLRFVDEQRQRAERDRAEAEEAERLRSEQELREQEKNAESLRKQAEDKGLAAVTSHSEQERLEAEENPALKEEPPVDERYLRNESDQVQHLIEQRAAAKAEDLIDESRLLQAERLDEKIRDEIEKGDTSHETESFREEKAEGVDEKSVGAEQIRRKEGGGKAADKEIYQVIAHMEKDQVEPERDYCQTEQPVANDGLQNGMGVDDNIDCFSPNAWKNITDKPSGRAREPHSNMAPKGQTQDVEIKGRRDDRKNPAGYQTKSRQRQTQGIRDQSPELHRSLKSDRSTKDSTSSQPKSGSLVEDDVFGFHIAASGGSSKTKEMYDLQAQILAFRRRLECMNISEVARPRKSSPHLPNTNQSKKMAREFSSISSGVSLLPRSASDPSVDVELRSLRTEIENSVELIKRVEHLAHLADDIQKCDAALSDLLEHIDSFPASPKANLSYSETTLLEATPEEELHARLAFTRGMMETMLTNFGIVSTDLRAISEKTRILQTWSELEDMAHDLKDGRKSRPISAISSRPSSGRSSSASNTHTRAKKKPSAYSNLNPSSSSPHQRLLLPRHPTPRRAVSGSTVESQSRPVSQLSHLSSNRAVSGPFRPSVYSSTFASRQRTSSLSNSQFPSTAVPVHSRAQTAQHSRVASPAGSDISSSSRPIRSHTRPSTSMSTSSRAPRTSLSSTAPSVRNTTPKNRSAMPRKTYIADPKNKLDMAVGDVVNKLPVGINVEGVAETWKDQSGKYWIGNHDPKLCFCRILRSQTVMVRVGGGWSELSKFIRDHFADSFRLLPESPPRIGSSEEKWISSNTLLDSSVELGTPPVPPRTPEPASPFVPSFSLSTPNGKSPRSLHSASNSPSTKGSPLTPLQFIRRADVDSILRPGTPSKPSTTFSPRAMTQTHTATRNSIWRP